MGIGNILVLSQATGYVLGFILSFFLLIPMAVNSQDFNGNCLLYATGTWNESTGMLKTVAWGSSSLCNYTIFVGLLSLVLTFIFAIKLAFTLFRDTESSWLAAFITLLVNVTLSFFFIIASCVLSSGLSEWCKMLTQKGSSIHSCETADILDFIDDKKINTKEFYMQLGMAQFGSWCLWVVWTFQVVFSSIKLYKYGQQESFMTSMTRERQRLLQRVNQNSYNPVT